MNPNMRATLQDSAHPRPLPEPSPGRSGRWFTHLVLLALSFSMALNPGCDCDEDPGSGLVDACGNLCIPGLEVCDPLTGLCVPSMDMDVGSDIRDTTPDQPDLPIDVPDEEVHDPDAPMYCAEDSDCPTRAYPNTLYCGPDDVCILGCRVDDPETPQDEDTCPGDLRCHPETHQCVSVLACLDDRDCPSHQYCDLDSTTCQLGCRTEPDNCPRGVGLEDTYCDEDLRICIDGPCLDDTDCPDAFYCEDQILDGFCVFGCRTADSPGGDTCGGCDYCDPITRTCGPKPCSCSASDPWETCDTQCDDEGVISGCYCNRQARLCQPGCRFFTGTGGGDLDNCASGSICDPLTRACVPGCRVDTDCDYGTYCYTYTNSCIPGCQVGHCDTGYFCCTSPAGCGTCGDRQCCQILCTLDTECAPSQYCSSGGHCADGCRTSPDNCPGDDTFCDPADRQCRLMACTELCGDCPPGEYCSDDSICVPGCAGDDTCCPGGQPCTERTTGIFYCGCISDDDCPGGTHCTSPVCEPDCDANSCPPGTSCDFASGRCLGGCLDPVESAPYLRDDTPETARCVRFSETEPDTHCRPGSSDWDLEHYCDRGDYCIDAYSCTASDFDWYVMRLYSGDRISFRLTTNQPSTSGTITMVWYDANLAQIAWATDSIASGEIGITERLISSPGNYYLRVFSTSSERVDYRLSIATQRVYLCFEDRFEPNEAPNSYAPKIPASESLERYYLSICEADFDYIGLDLFAGQVFHAVVDPAGRALTNLLSLAAGPALEPPTNINPFFYGAPYTDPLDSENLNAVAIESTIPFTDTWFLRINAPPPYTLETDYTLSTWTEPGSATCSAVHDPFEPNNEMNLSTLTSRARLNIANYPDDLRSRASFNGGRLCPADNDYFALVVLSGLEGAYLTATLGNNRDEHLLEMALFNSSGNPITNFTGNVRSSITYQVPASGTYWVEVRLRSGLTLPYMGAAFDLEFRYESSPCEDDSLEPNDDPATASPLHEDIVIAWGDGYRCSSGGDAAFTSSCLAADAGCLCQHTRNLVLCPYNEDWYSFTALAGDIFNVRVVPNPDQVPSSEIRNITAQLYRQGSTSDPITTLVPGTTDLRTSSPIQATRQGTSPIPLSTYLLYIYSPVMVDPFDYEVHIEVFGKDSRGCPADPWDAPIEFYPNANEDSCQVSSCILRADGVGVQGHLCYWDEQDWLTFTLANQSTMRLFIRFLDELGELQALLFRDIGGSPGGPAYPSCPSSTGTPSDPGCHCHQIREVNLFGNSMYGCLLPPNRPREFDQPGADYVFRDLPAGTYHVLVRMRGTPNYFTAFSSLSPCNDGVWSPGEECDVTGRDGDTCSVGSCNTTTCHCQ